MATDREKMGRLVLEASTGAYGAVAKKLALELSAALAAPPVEQQARALTYSSTQATECAGCGVRKHTPLRIDAMGGYVCLTCIDNKLGSMLGEFGHPEPAQPAPQAGAADPDSVPTAQTVRPTNVELESWRRKATDLRGCNLSSISRRFITDAARMLEDAYLSWKDNPTEQPSQDAEAVLVAMADGYKVEKTVPWDAITDEANRDSAWMVSRSAPPFCDKKSMRIWTGPTAIAAVRRAQDAMGPAIAAHAAQAQAQGESKEGTK